MTSDSLPVRVLFVTDVGEKAERMGALLAPFNISIVKWTTLIGLYASIVRELPDVVLVDGGLPRLGIEAAARFLQAKGIADRYPIVLVASASADDGDPASLALALRASDFVPHDAAPAVLARALTRGAHGRNGFSQQAPGGFDEVTAERPLPRNADFLIVDDDPAITRLIRRILEGRYAVHVENGGQAAIDACKTHAFRAVFCDLRMPDVSGADVFRAISERDPALARRVVFVTAHELDAAEAEFFMGLNNTLIRKPFAIRDILGAAARVLGDN